MTHALLKSTIIARALAEGFDVARVVHPSAIADAPQRLQAFLAAGHHGEMEWLHARADQRASPSTLWPEVRSILMLGQNYGPDENPLPQLDQRDTGYVSIYARRDDYHDVMKGRLKRLGQWIGHHTGAPLKVFVDTAPVMEKPLAAAAGIGWQGKHTNLVSRQFGSWLFLGAIYLSVELAADETEPDHCGNCTKCLDICPTQAFPAPYQLDARRCISYLTIEHKGQIPLEFRAAIGNRIYGCDDCLAVCPWNKFAQESRDVQLAMRDDLAAMPLRELLKLDDASFRALFRKTPIKRIGWARFMRNCLLAAGNSGDAELLPFIAPFATHEDAILSEMAVWAMDILTLN